MNTQATRFFTIVLFTQLLSACFFTDMLRTDRTIAERVNDVKILLTAAYASIGSDAQTGLITPDEAQKRFDKVKRTREKLNRVEEIIKLGDLELADLKLRVVEEGMTSIRKYISEKANEA